MLDTHETAIQCSGVMLSYGQRCVLHNLNLMLPKGAHTAIVGPSGSGKTSLLNILAGLVQPDDGKVFVAGLEVSAASSRLRAKHRQQEVAIVFQFGELLPELTIGENVELPLRLRGEQPSKDLIKKTLSAVGLFDYSTAWPSQLSGGETQRAAVARALVTRPSVLLCDEPTGALDTVASAEITDLLCNVAAHTNTTLLVATHDQNVAKAMDTVLLLHNQELKCIA